jgi:hypothetical protein
VDGGLARGCALGISIFCLAGFPSVHNDLPLAGLCESADSRYTALMPRKDITDWRVRSTGEDFLARVGLTAEGVQAAGVLVWRALLIGTALYLSLSEDRYVNLQRNLIAYIVAFVWCYYDGLLVKRRWSLAWIEAILLHLLVVQVGNILSFVFGDPLRTLATG